MEEYSKKITSFSAVFLYDEFLDNLEIADFKKALKLEKKEKTTSIEISELGGLAVLSLDTRKKSITIEGKRIIIADKQEGPDWEGFISIFNPIKEILGRYKLKAFGFNYDIILTKEKGAGWCNFFSKEINKMLDGYNIPQFGLRFLIEDKKDKFNIEISWIGEKKESLLVHFNAHIDNPVVLDSRNLKKLSDKYLNKLFRLISPITS